MDALICDAGDPTQGFVHVRQTPQLSCSSTHQTASDLTTDCIFVVVPIQDGIGLWLFCFCCSGLGDKDAAGLKSDFLNI